MRHRLLITAILLIGLIVGYLAGCQSRVHSRTVTQNPTPGQHWRDHDGAERIVRGLTHEGQHTSVWWFRSGFHKDRHCTIETWRRWARSKGAKPE